MGCRIITNYDLRISIDGGDSFALFEIRNSKLEIRAGGDR